MRQSIVIGLNVIGLMSFVYPVPLLSAIVVKIFRYFKLCYVILGC